MITVERIKNNINIIKDKINKAANGKDISLVAVTKTFSAQDIEFAVQYGIEHIGESKVQEALPKFEELKAVLNGVNKHFIGHLQSNKAKKTVMNFDMIHSLDSIELADGINRHAGDINKIQECLIELKVSDEATKYGVGADKIGELYAHCLHKCPNINIAGLMTIAPCFENKENIRPYFRQAYEVFSNIRHTFKNGNFKILSMGMSGDFEMAIEEGSNMVRIGSAIFGERIYDK